MNDEGGASQHLTGFTLDSLLKLQSAKAFDKKTSILQYVITLIFRNDENCLCFPDDLTNVGTASRYTLHIHSSYTLYTYIFYLGYNYIVLLYTENTCTVNNYVF
jgi:hypothetical protein